MIWGWLTVQVLPMLLYSCEMDEDGMEPSINAAQNLDEQMQGVRHGSIRFVSSSIFPLIAFCVYGVSHGEPVRPENFNGALCQSSPWPD